MLVPIITPFSWSLTWENLEPKACHTTWRSLHYAWKYCKMLISFSIRYETLCAIWYRLYNFKNVEDTHGRVLVLVKSQTGACKFTKSSIPPSLFFSRFLICINGTKSRKASQKYKKLGMTWLIIPTGIYLFKVNNGNTRTVCETCSICPTGAALEDAVFIVFHRLSINDKVGN